MKRETYAAISRQHKIFSEVIERTMISSGQARCRGNRPLASGGQAIYRPTQLAPHDRRGPTGNNPSGHGYRCVPTGTLFQGRTGPPGCLAKARWAGAAVGRFDKNDNFKKKLVVYSL